MGAERGKHQGSLRPAKGMEWRCKWEGVSFVGRGSLTPGGELRLCPVGHGF